MKKVLLLIGIIIALTTIVHAETKDRREVLEDKPSRQVPSSYETLTVMRDIIDIQTRMLKGSENKKAMLRELAQLREKPDGLILQVSQDQAGIHKAAPPEQLSSAPAAVSPPQTAQSSPPSGMP